MEEWKDIIGYETYSISSYGQVKINKKNKLMVQITTATGYKRVCLTKDGKGKMMSVHRLVAMGFLPNPDNKATVNHKNHIRNDNRVDNLEWATQQEQCLHSHHKLGKSREKHISITPYSKYQVNIIRNYKSVFCKTYDALEEAIEHRNNYLLSIR